jgi:pantetheine-phosphate adenylyltransferase
MILKAAYAGTFDPFTNGHMAVYLQAKELFSDVVVLIAHSPTKDKRMFSEHSMRSKLNEIGIRAELCHGLVSEYCQQNGIEFLVRGLRDATDFFYEETIAEINKRLNPNLKTVYFRADDRAISSSMVRELVRFRKDVSEYLPYSLEGMI